MHWERFSRKFAAGAVAAAVAMGAGLPLLAQEQPPEPDRSKNVLALERQKLIWDLEHITFKIETYFGDPLLEKLRAGKGSEAAGRFHDDFSGRLFADGDGGRRVSGPVSEWVRDSGRHELRNADSRATLAYLGRLAGAFTRVEGGRIQLLAIEPAPADDGEDRWTTRLLLRLRGDGPGDAPRELEAVARVVFRFPWKAEIGEMPVVESWAVEQETIRTSSRRLMEEVTESSGLAGLLADNWKLPPGDAKRYRFQIAVEDYDRDGWLDIAVGSSDRPPMLLRNVDGRRFEDVAASVGLSTPADRRPAARHALTSWADLDNDGYPELISGERVYRNESGKRFSDITVRSKFWVNRVPIGIVLADFDADGRIDLYLLHQKSFDAPPPRGNRPWVGDAQSGGPNDLWLNRGDGRLTNATERWDAAGGRRQTFAASALFYDDDHLPDLYVANDFGRNVLLRNTGDGKFVDATEGTGLGDFATSMGVSAGDLDNDGRSELYVANMFSKMGRRIIAHVSAEDYPEGVYDEILGSCAGNRLYRPGSGDTHHEFSDDAGVNGVGWAYAPAMVDLDADGLLDLYATTGFMSFARGKPDG